ncbi:reverse transcriptase (RNA-dependent DNA polymerase) domain-containing protein [Hirsutella rhossiliensis]|uniref:RNA-directed DNA polymerase n=1 Tax=Hirsutella rhossiliensis TaxID=111463 RepID=A0A9P8MK24_9HYPO|nr:reverse transcriptase (RNA-dependent DNA polymerase) domain-containing protein [Hirsutella rhossiliensis]KAH0957778.1 reverse transcriptase (RNA-dependent DNA polymerase) domain-containing protein [Hirsutella rhossiliensis]
MQMMSQMAEQLQNPPRFEGVRSKFRAWLSEMKNKLRVDGRDSRAGQIAILEAKRQGKLCDTAPRFEKELADSGGATWPEEVKISYLEGALSPDLRLATVYAAPTRSTYSEWVRSLQRLSSGLEGVEKGTPFEAVVQPMIVEAATQTEIPKWQMSTVQVTSRRNVATQMWRPRTSAAVTDAAGRVISSRNAQLIWSFLAKRRKNGQEPPGGNPIRVLVDSGCDCYAVIDEAVVRKFRILSLIRSLERSGILESSESVTSPGVVAVVVETAGFDERIFAYVVPSLGQDMFLGRPWMERNQVVYDAAKRQVFHGRAGVTIRLMGQEEPAKLGRHRKALQPKPPVDPSKMVPAEVLKEFRNLFSPEEAMKLPPHRPGVDHEVNLQPDKNGNEPPLPWGPLYNMSREEFSAAAAPVLFRDRYPLPLIAETLQNLAKAKWFTKLDVVAAFHKIRMAPGHEWKTAFRTRFGLYEWLVCPFGLSGAPASFQRYMNSVLREWLDDFVTAYLDDVLIYSSGSKADHEAKVRKVLQALADAGLHLDPAKCEFSVQEVKYLGFIVNAGKGIACDPEKQHAIREWEAPTTVKGVRSFLGFANYYRIFIPDYAKITQPLDALLKKGTAFCWGRAENEAFHELKRRFCESPVLKQWDPSLQTFLETDCSGYALGGVLAQEDQDGRRHACAFFSKRLSPAEYNYPIHDKEMLAIMRCLDNWSAELRSCGSFTILTDHRNLEYFMTRQKLTERQSRWAAELSQFDFKLEYRPGSEAVVPDALSRREQDKPQGIDDEREQGRMIQLIPDDAIPATTRARINAASSNFSEPFVLPEMKIFEEADLQQLWDETAEKDPIFKEAYRAVQNCERTFPPALGLKVQISECAIDAVEKGFLKPLPIPDRPRSHLSMDFITDLPPTGPSKARYLWVIVDRLTKAVTLECHYRFHGMPRSIVSDRGSNWLKRMNQEIEAYLRAYVSYVQDDWENCSCRAAGTQQSRIRNDQDQPLLR